MPTTAGVYTAGLTNGTEVASTYEGRHITVLESELMHPYHVADDLVNKGDPVIIVLADAATPHGVRGMAVGVALASATAITDYIAVDTEGIWNLNVNAFDDQGGTDVNPGDALFISDDSVSSDDLSHDGVGDCVISKIRNNAVQVPFGYALGQIGTGAYGVIADRRWGCAQNTKVLNRQVRYIGANVKSKLYIGGGKLDRGLVPALPGNGQVGLVFYENCLVIRAVGPKVECSRG